MESTSISTEHSGASFDIILLNESKAKDSDVLESYINDNFITMLPAIVYTHLMIVLGLPGNIIVFFIYLLKWRRSTSRIFILFLAALDTLNCSINLPMEIYIMWNSFQLDSAILCKLSRYSTYVMNSSSAVILVGIAADRFIRICRPYQRAFTECQSRYISIVAIVWSMATTWPSIILYGTRSVNLGNNVTGSVCLIENRFDRSPYPLVYLVFMVTTTTITFVTLIVLYYLVGLQIYRHRKFKLKHCTHVQKIVDDKSVTVKPKLTSNVEKSLDKDIYSSKRTFENTDNNAKQSLILPERHENELKPYQLGLPPPCNDAGTSCGLLDLPYQDGGGQQDTNFHVSEVSTKTEVYSLNNVDDGKISRQGFKNQEQQLQKDKGRKRESGVRYLLVRGVSTINSSGSGSCSNCLTVRIGRSTLMLFLITIAYVISFLPFYILVIVRQMDNNFIHRMSKSGLAAHHVFLRSYLLSSAVNPFIYSFCNAQFRDYCKSTFSRCILKNKRTFKNRS